MIIQRESISRIWSYDARKKGGQFPRELPFQMMDETSLLREDLDVMHLTEPYF
jgi:hypothetical protein